jgi:hypothetical protein
VNRNLKALLAAFVTAAGLVACGDSASFTLYRNSLLDENMRIHTDPAARRVFSFGGLIRIARIWLHGGYTKASQQKARPCEPG